MPDEDGKPTAADLLATLHDSEFMAEEGARITPKGHMAMVLMELGVGLEVAERVSQEMCNRIFLAGFLYVDAPVFDLGDADE